MLLVGLVRRPHGLHGEVSVESRTEFPDRFAPGATLEWQGSGRTEALIVRSVRPHGSRLLVAFEGVGDVDAARALAGGALHVADEEAAPPRPGFYYSHQVEGWRCEDRAGRLAGIVRLLEQTPAGPLLSIELASGKEALVPFVSPIVVSVDESERRIVIDPPDGLLDV